MTTHRCKQYGEGLSGKMWKVAVKNCICAPDCDDKKSVCGYKCKSKYHYSDWLEALKREGFIEGVKSQIPIQKTLTDVLEYKIKSKVEQCKCIDPTCLKCDCKHCKNEDVKGTKGFFNTPAMKKAIIKAAKESTDEQVKVLKEAGYDFKVASTGGDKEDAIEKIIDILHPYARFMSGQTGSNARATAHRIVKEVIASEIAKARQDVLAEYNKWIAYCDCGDALERTRLYPSEATYYCMGCDKTYELKSKI